MENKNTITNQKLTQEDALLIYSNYLSTLRLDNKNIMRKPMKLSLYNAMCKIHLEQTQSAEFLMKQAIENNGKIYFWSDQHFNHKNIINIVGRPFEDMEHMNSYMFEQYRKKIKPEDLVIWGGDIAFGPIENISKILSNLPGKKLLVMGNHDFDAKNNFKNYNAFDSSLMVFSYQENIDNNICNVIVTHYPLDLKYIPENTVNIHGHIHAYLAGEKRINMSVEQTQYMPVQLNIEIRNEFAKNCLNHKSISKKNIKF